MQKPSAILHMMGYGLVYGFLLSVLYIFVGTIWHEKNGDFVSSIEVSFFTGALPGALLGFIDGCILRFLTRYLNVPIDVTDFRQKSNLSYFIIGGLTIAGMGLLMLLPMIVIIAESDSWLTNLWFILPIPIAVIAAIYAVHRYFLKLRAWGSVGKVKNKAKHTPTNQLAYDDAAEAENYLDDEGVNQQQKNG
jgi:uncharacterized membrane protein